MMTDTYLVEIKYTVNSFVRFPMTKKFIARFPAKTPQPTVRSEIFNRIRERLGKEKSASLLYYDLTKISDLETL